MIRTLSTMCLLCVIASMAFAQNNLKDNSLLAMGTPLYNEPTEYAENDATNGYRECTLNAEAEAAKKRMLSVAPNSKVWSSDPTQVDKSHMSVTKQFRLKQGDYYFCAVYGKKLKGRAWYDYSGVKGYSKKRVAEATSICNGFYLEEEKSVEIWFDSVDRKKACVQLIMINNPK